MTPDEVVFKRLAEHARSYAREYPAHSVDLNDLAFAAERAEGLVNSLQELPPELGMRGLESGLGRQLAVQADNFINASGRDDERYPEPDTAIIRRISVELEQFVIAETETVFALTAKVDYEYILPRAMWRDSLRQLGAESESALRAIKLHEEDELTRTRLRELGGLIALARQATSAIAESDMSGEFITFGEKETRSGDMFRWSALASVSLLIAFAAYSATVAGQSTGESLHRLGVLIAGFALFGYLAREASHHRSNARWVQVMSVQLKSIDAYAASMSEERRQELRAAFGSRVFSEVPGAEAGDRGSLAVAADLNPTIERISELVRQIQKTKQRSDEPVTP